MYGLEEFVEAVVNTSARCSVSKCHGEEEDDTCDTEKEDAEGEAHITRISITQARASQVCACIQKVVICLVLPFSGAQ